MPLESRPRRSAGEHRRTRLLMLVLHLVILPKRLRSHARELQLGVRTIRGLDGIRYAHVYLPRQTCL